MAEDLGDFVESFPFHPCESPRGMLHYNVQILTPAQQNKVNSLKLKTIRENERYLHAHPEIRAILSLITRLVLKERPREDIHLLISQYFTRPREDIQQEIEEYMRARGTFGDEEDISTLLGEDDFVEGEEEEVMVDNKESDGSEGSKDFKSVSAVDLSIDISNLDAVPYEMLNRIIEDAMRRLQIDADDVDDEGDAADVQSEVRRVVMEGCDASEDMRALIENEILERIYRMGDGDGEGDGDSSIARPSLDVGPTESSFSTMDKRTEEGSTHNALDLKHHEEGLLKPERRIDEEETSTFTDLEEKPEEAVAEAVGDEAGGGAADEIEEKAP